MSTPSLTPSSLSYAEALTALNVVEQELRTRLTGEIYSQGESFKLEDFFYFAVELENFANQSHNATAWAEVEYRVVNLRLNRMVEFMQKNLQDAAAKTWQTLFPSYKRALTDAIMSLRHRALVVSQSQANEVNSSIEDAIPESKHQAPLSQKALWITHNVEGISSVLCGMRTPDYVRDVLALEDWPVQTTSVETLAEIQKIEAALS